MPSRFPAGLCRTRVRRESWIREWVMFTSGTTGAPKMVAHSLAALTGAIAPAASDRRSCGALSTISAAMAACRFCCARRLGGASLVLSEPGEAVARFSGAAGRGRRHASDRHAVALAPRPDEPGHRAHRAALSAPVGRDRRPGGAGRAESAFPDAAIGHAYASTEAGVGFEVSDGLEGFPAEFIGRDGPVEMRVVEGSLRIRSPRSAAGYVGSSEALKEDGWVDTGDWSNCAARAIISPDGAAASSMSAA